MKYENFTLISRDGLKINAGCWTSQEEKAIFCIVHGIGEHFKRYAELAEHLSSQGFAVFSYDQRGHGNSEGKRGHSAAYSLLLDDVENIMKYARSQFPDLPLILYGHSWGGNIAANFVIKSKTKEISAAILSAPWFDLKIQLPPLILTIGGFLSKLFPSLTQDNKVVPEHLSKDSRLVKAYTQDPLVHRKISLATYFQAFRQGIWAVENAYKLKIPTLVMHGTDDLITSWEASKKFAENAPSMVYFKSWKGVKHEPHNDLEKLEVYDFMIDWLLNNMSPSLFTK